jgi:hypothetical protein
MAIEEDDETGDYTVVDDRDRDCAQGALPPHVEQGFFVKKLHAKNGLQGGLSAECHKNAAVRFSYRYETKRQVENCEDCEDDDVPVHWRRFGRFQQRVGVDKLGKTSNADHFYTSNDTVSMYAPPHVAL